MSDKIREFYELIHSMNHGDLRRIARSITEQISEKENSAGFDASDYRDFCDVLFDCASREMDEADFGAMDGATELEDADDLPPRSFAETESGSPVSAFARKGA